MFIIVAEGQREDEYFRYFSKISRRLKIHIVPREKGRSSPNDFLRRVTNYLAKEFDTVLESKGEEKAPETYDYLWFVLDVDMWQRAQIDEIQHHCNNENKWSIAISNPCFEIWLHNHMAAITSDAMLTCKEFKHAISRFNNHEGYAVHRFASKINDAIERSRRDDQHPEHYYPEIRTTKVYLLAEKMAKFLGNGWTTQ